MVKYIFKVDVVEAVCATVKTNIWLLAVNPFSPNSDQDPFSPNNIQILSTDKLWELLKWYPSKNALIFYQILLTHSVRKCIEISLENLYVDTGAWRVKSVCKLRPKSLLLAPSCVPGLEYVPWLVCLKSHCSICQSG